jgi:predicted ester cyclase
VRATNSCVQDSFLGIPARGKAPDFSATLIHRIGEGKILQTWRSADDFGRLLPLGARIGPAPSEPS